MIIDVPVAEASKPTKPATGMATATSPSSAEKKKKPVSSPKQKNLLDSFVRPVLKPVSAADSDIVTAAGAPAVVLDGASTEIKADDAWFVLLL